MDVLAASALLMAVAVKVVAFILSCMVDRVSEGVEDEVCLVVIDNVEGGAEEEGDHILLLLCKRGPCR